MQGSVRGGILPVESGAADALVHSPEGGPMLAVDSEFTTEARRHGGTEKSGGISTPRKHCPDDECRGEHHISE